MFKTKKTTGILSPSGSRTVSVRNAHDNISAIGTENNRKTN